MSPRDAFSEVVGTRATVLRVLQKQYANASGELMKRVEELVEMVGKQQDPRPMVLFPPERLFAMGEELVGHPATPAAVLDELVNHPVARVRRRLAAHDNLSHEAVERLAVDEDSSVRVVVAERKYLDESVLRVLVEDEATAVRVALVRRSQGLEGPLVGLLDDQAHVVRCGARSRVDKVAARPSVSIRGLPPPRQRGAKEVPDCSADESTLLARVKAGGDLSDVVLRIATDGGLTAHTLESLAEFPHSVIRLAAYLNSSARGLASWSRYQDLVARVSLAGDAVLGGVGFFGWNDGRWAFVVGGHLPVGFRFIEVDVQLDETMLRLARAIETEDWGWLYTEWSELCPWWCPECRKLYSADHWQPNYHPEEDCCICPRGHWRELAW